MGQYRILAFDGGGVRGVVIAVILERLLKAVPHLIETADLLAGTSSGGILALSLASGLTPTRLRELFESRGQAIFHDSRRVFSAEAGQASAAGYDNEALCRELKHSLGETRRLMDLQKRVLVPAFDLDNEAADPSKRSWTPRLFHNSPDSKDGDRRVYQVALYTSAAPIYFPSMDGFIDGGVYASNPSMVALTHALDERIETPAATLQNLRLLSFSNGNAVTYIPGERHDWGCAHWLSAGLLELINDASVTITDVQCRQILRQQYFRFAPLLPSAQHAMLDESTRLPELVDYAEHVDLSDLIVWVEENW